MPCWRPWRHRCSRSWFSYRLRSWSRCNSPAQLTPRIIGLVFKDPVNRLALTLFVFTFTFSLGTLIRITSSVPSLTLHVAAYGCVVSLAVFLFMIDHVGKASGPAAPCRRSPGKGGKVIERVYPDRLAELPASAVPTGNLALGGEAVATIASPNDGVVLAFDQDGLLSLAQRGDCVIEMIPQVGDHVAAGDTLFRIFPETATISAAALRGSVAVGQERTLEQDPTFAFRIMVDIASKALSPAINDPTTAVLALDQIHHLLHTVGQRHLDTGRVRDAAGRLRLVYRTPDWKDFVRLAVTEIRQFGGESIQVARRLRAMLEKLIQTLPDPRAVLLRQEMTLLQRSTKRFFSEPEDRRPGGRGRFPGSGGQGGGKTCLNRTTPRRDNAGPRAFLGLFTARRWKVRNRSGVRERSE